MGAIRRLYTRPPSKPYGSMSMGTKDPKAFSSGDRALTDADGFVAEADRFLIMGKEAATTHPEILDDGEPPEPLQLADVVVVSDSTPESTQADSATAESSEQVAKLGEAAIAVNEAEDSLVEIAEGLEAGQTREGLRGVVQDAKGKYHSIKLLRR